MTNPEDIKKLRQRVEHILEKTALSYDKPFAVSKVKNFDDRLKEAELDKKIAEIEAMRLDTDLKKHTLLGLFIILGIETVLVFVLTFFQGFALGGFHLEEWSYKLLLTATILQISFMLSVAVNHLFPKKH